MRNGLDDVWGRLAFGERLAHERRMQLLDIAETQMIPLREFVQAQGWQSAGEFVDRAPATDLRGRTAWRDLLDRASKRQLDMILVWRIDRPFRSVVHMATTVEQLRRWGVGLRSYNEPMIDTSGASPLSDLLLNLMASFAQFERSLIAERVRAGMDRARKQGKRLGRPRKVNGEWDKIGLDVREGRITRLGAARLLTVSDRTVYRLSRQNGSAT